MGISLNKTGALAMLARSQKTVQAATVTAAAAGAKVLYDAAKANVPEKTGTLKSAIYRVKSKDNSTDDRTEYHVSVNRKKAPHFHLVELGTSRSPAHPFLGKAKAEKGDEAVRVMNETMRKEINSD